MRFRRWCWSLTLLAWPLAVLAGEAPLRVMPLRTAPVLAAGAPAQPAAGRVNSEPRAWLHAPRRGVRWYAVWLAADWRAASPPLLEIHGATRARVVAYVPPDYRPHAASVFDPTLDPTLSHHAVVYQLPANLTSAQPVYLALGSPGQTQPVEIAIVDTATYRAADLWHIRTSTFLASVLLSLALVIGCFWVVLRDRVFLFFMTYVGAQLVYSTAVSGELFALPDTAWIAAAGYRTGQAAVAVAAAFSIWFILDFAELRHQTPRLARWLAAMVWPYLALAVIVWVPWLRPDAWLPNTVNGLLVLSTLLALVATWWAWRAGSRQAGFFLLSWVPLLALTLARVVQLITGLPLPAWLEYGVPGSMAWSAIIITVGLADSTLQVRRERDDVARRAQLDPLTDVFNRGAIMERLQRAWRWSSAMSEPLAVLFLDLDHFKQINDSRGHAAGDACLRAVTAVIRAELNQGDRVGRYGGEEFVVMLRGDSARMAEHVAERIVARTAALRVAVGTPPIALTVSIGVVVRDHLMVDPEAMVEYADQAQYQAKAEGRNRVVVWRRAVAMATAADAR